MNNATERSIKQILQRTRPLLQLIERIGGYVPRKQDRIHLAEAAYHLAFGTSTNTKRVEDEAVTIMQRWLNDDNRELIRHANRASNFTGKRKVPDVDYTVLPWGATAPQLSDSGVININAATTIEQVGADNLLNTSEAADELLKVLDFTVENYGLHGMVWLVASIETLIGPKLRELGLQLNGTEETRIRRVVHRIVDDVKNQFEEN